MTPTLLKMPDGLIPVAHEPAPAVAYAVECYSREPLCNGTRQSGDCRFPLREQAEAFAKIVHPTFTVIEIHPVFADGTRGEGCRVRGPAQAALPALRVCQGCGDETLHFGNDPVCPDCLFGWEIPEGPLPPRESIIVDNDAYRCVACGHETPSGSLNDQGLCWYCEHHGGKVTRCRKCNALATDDNPVEPEAEECLACSHDRGREFGPMPVVEREF